MLPTGGTFDHSYFLKNLMPELIFVTYFYYMLWKKMHCSFTCCVIQFCSPAPFKLRILCFTKVTFIIIISSGSSTSIVTKWFRIQPAAGSTVMCDRDQVSVESCFGLRST